MPTLNEYSTHCHYASSAAGWWKDADHQTPAVKIALIHSEISEALEGLRKDTFDDHLPHRKSIEVELVDALIRIFDLAGRLKLDLDGAFIEKMKYNESRLDHKLETRADVGGKKF